jgi:hypothetical protein
METLISNPVQRDPIPSEFKDVNLHIPFLYSPTGVKRLASSFLNLCYIWMAGRPSP